MTAKQCLRKGFWFLEIGLSDANYDAFNAEGLNTLGTFAFACNYAPGASDERPLVNLATNVLGNAPSTKEMACIRRLFSEAYSTIAADIRTKVEACDEASVKKLAPAERSQRLKDQQARLAGLDLRGNYEPGDSLVDRAVAAYDIMNPTVSFTYHGMFVFLVTTRLLQEQRRMPTSVSILQAP